MKVFVVLHRCLQDFDLSQAVAQELSEKTEILTNYKKKPTDNTYGKLSAYFGHLNVVPFCINVTQQNILVKFFNIDAKMNLLISQLYCAYLKFLIKYMVRSKILSVRISEVTRQVKKMKNKDIFTAYENFDSMITQIIQMFENNDY